MSAELRDRSARLVMGWHSGEIPWAYELKTSCWHDADDVPVLTTHTWRPDEDDRQLMMVLERMTELGYRYQLEGAAQGAIVCFESGDGARVRREHRDRRLALLEAAVEIIDR